MSEYAVEGYGAAARNPEYDGPYLDGYMFDPAVAFAFAGDPEKQAELQKIIDDTEGAPVLVNGAVTIVTAEGEPNVVVLTKEPADTKTVVLAETEVDRINKENAEAELQSQTDPDSAGKPEGTLDSEQENVVNLDGPSGADESRDGADYNPTANDGPRNEDDDKNGSITVS